MGEGAITEFLLPEGLSELLAESMQNLDDGTLVVLPTRLRRSGGLYRDDLLTAVKELKAAGVSARFLHPLEQRTGLSEFSVDAVFVFAIGVAQNMTQDVAKAVFQYVRRRASEFAKAGENPVVRLDVARLRRPGLEIEGLSLTAPVDDSNADLFLRLLVGGVAEREEGSGGGRATGED